MKIGIVISDSETPSQTEVNFIYFGTVVKTGQFIEIRTTEDKVFIAQVEAVRSSNPEYSNPSMIWYAMRKDRHFDPAKLFPTFEEHMELAKARILGVFDINSQEFDFTGECPHSGLEVHTVNESRLNNVLNYEKNGGFYIGRLHFHKKISVDLNPKILFYHMAIVGTTGSGKSYAGATLCEEMAKNKIPVIVLDPHGEYASLSKPSKENKEILKEWGIKSHAFDVIEYTPPSTYIEGTKLLTINLSDLTSDDIIEAIEIPGAQQQNLLYTAMASFKEGLESITPTLKNLLQLIRKVGTQRRYRNDTITSLCIRLGLINALGILGEGIEIKDLVKSGKVSILNISGMDILSERIFVAAILRRLFDLRKRDQIPPFNVLIEEIHRYAPGAALSSKKVISSVVKEGRKFGIGVIALSQRPGDIDKDILSQCNTKLIFKLTETSDLNAITTYLGIASENKELIPYFPPGRSILVGLGSYFPNIIDIRLRHSMHGGETARPLSPKPIKKLKFEEILPPPPPPKKAKEKKEEVNEKQKKLFEE